MDEKKRTTMSVPEMRRMLGLGKTDSYWLVHMYILLSSDFSAKMYLYYRLAENNLILALICLSVVRKAVRSGQMLNMADIARDADINQKQAKDWLGILETLGIIFYLHPYSNNMLKRLVKTAKLYFYDTGLVCAYRRISSSG